MDEKKFTFLLQQALLGSLDSVQDAVTFRDDGVMTRNEGLVVTLDDGSEFQLTVVQSR